MSQRPEAQSESPQCAVPWWSRVPVHVPCILAAVTLLWCLFLVQAYVFIGYFEPAFLTMPTVAGVLLGGIIGHTLALRDKLRREQSQFREISLRDDRYQTAAAAAEFTIWDWKFEEDHIFCTPVVTGHLEPGSPPIKMAHKWWIEQIHPDDRADYLCALNDHVEGRTERYRHEYRARSMSGEYIWIADRGQVYLDADGKPARFSGVSTDITVQKAAEAALLAAKEDAEIANRAKSEFLANMSHELRTPLNAILGFSEVMTRQEFGPLGNPLYAEYATDINVSGSHLLAIINDVLDVCRVEAGRMELAESAIDLSETFEFVHRMFRPRAEEKSLALALSVDAEVGLLWADERAVKQILLNLVSNSIKFTPEHGDIQVEARPDGDDGILIGVRDSGVGIPEKDLRLVLEPFGQSGETLTRGNQGTGLGLALTKGLVELHGGSLALSSRQGEGTAVELRFPGRSRPQAEQIAGPVPLRSVGP